MGAQREFQRARGASRGEFLAFCEGDDYWTAEDKLARQVAVLTTRPEVALCFHAALIVDQGSLNVLRAIGAYRRPRDFMLPEVILGGGGMMPTASIVLRREALCPIDDWLLNSPVGDYLLAIWAASTGLCHALPDAMSVYRTGLSTSWSHADARIATAWRNVEGVIQAIEAFPQKSGREDARPAVRRIVRERLRILHLEYGSAANTLPARADYQSRLTSVDRLFVRACDSPSLRRLMSFGLAKLRVVRKNLGGW